MSSTLYAFALAVARAQAVRAWIRVHNQDVKQRERGVRILVCYLPMKSPWLNPIEPKGVHGKHAIVEPAHLLDAHELAERICSYFYCPHEEHRIQEKPVDYALGIPTTIPSTVPNNLLS